MKTDFFQMAEHLNFKDPQVDYKCMSAVLNPSRNEDFFYIPNGEYYGTHGYIKASRFCGNVLENAYVVSKGMGPFVVYVKTDEKLRAENLKREIGFRFMYNIFNEDVTIL